MGHSSKSLTEVIFGEGRQEAFCSGLQGAGAGPLHWELCSHPLLHLWKVQEVFSVVSGLELTAQPFLSPEAAVAARLGKHFPGRSEHAPGRKSQAMSSGLLPARRKAVRILSPRPSSSV